MKEEIGQQKWNQVQQ